MACPDHENCDKKICLEQQVCQNADYWANYWKNQAALKTQFQIGIERQLKALKKAKKAKWHKQAAARKNGVVFKKCDLSSKNCDKHKACSILGQCIFLHPLVFGNPDIRVALKGPVSTKEIVKIITPTMPNLARMGNRWFYHEFHDENG
jgi:hypothetical protein